MSIAAVDFETYYDSEVTIVTLGVHHYLRHPQSDIYLVAIATDTGIEFVGNPKDFDWTQISGPDWTWLSHNAQFDLPVFQRLQELEAGNTCEVREIAAWHDTADLAAFLGVPRSLKESSNFLLGTKLSKDVRDKMKGQRWDAMTPEFREDVCKYAIDDAIYCLKLFTQYGHLWPEHEREISQMTRQMALRGVPLDVPGLKNDIEMLKTALWEYKQSIPWKDDKALLSSVALREECHKHGLIPPESFAQGDVAAELFFKEHGDKFPWLMAVRDYRKASKHLSTLETMLKRERGDGWMSYGLKYGGAHTLRDSGDSGLNLQNLPKGIVSGVDIRAKIKAPEGFKFAICDLSQIEPRVLHWLAKDHKMLKFIKEIPDLYEAQARAWGLYEKEGSLKKNDPALRHQIKQLALGLGYGMGAVKFASVAGVEPDEAMRLTKLYRDKNVLITKLWRDLQNMFDASINEKDEEFHMELPSGRLMRYRQISGNEFGARAKIPRNGKMMELGFWGGIFCENLVQATARDVFMHQCLQIEKAGIPVLMRVHDEAVCLVPEESAQEQLDQIISIMSTAPEWAEGLPLAAEGSLSEVYKK
jgi:DNA polymerase I-like protein with 3'-5' exonuclease and polymerase domains